MKTIILALGVLIFLPVYQAVVQWSIASSVAADVRQGNVSQVAPFNITTEWQYDDYRNEIASVKKQEDWIKEWSKTNHPPGIYPSIMRNIIFQWNPKKGDRELGYRNDGMVVWREVPEGK